MPDLQPTRLHYVAAMRTEARFPHLPEDRGHYESFYLKAAAPEGGRAVWIRQTIHRRPGQPATCALWLTWFDSERPPAALKQQHQEGEMEFPDDVYLRISTSEIAPGRASGELSTESSRARWELTFDDQHDALHHLPSERMYDAGLPKTKLLSPHPGAMFDGFVEIDGERVELRGWPGMVGHNWGSEHADTWVWLHGAALGTGGDGFFDLAAGRIKIGPLRSPWLGNGMLALDGERHRLGGLKPRASKIDARPGRCEFIVRGDGVTIHGVASAPLERTVGWEYADPAGGTHDSLNCSIADLELNVSREGRPDVVLNVEGAAAYELGTGEGGHGVPIQPFGDG